MVYGNVRLGVEATLDPGEDTSEAFRQAKEKVNQSYKRLFGSGVDYESFAPPPMEYNGTALPETYPKTTPVIDRSIERLEILIDDCKTKEELLGVYESHNGKIETTPSLQNIYLYKLNSLNK